MSRQANQFVISAFVTDDTPKQDFMSSNYIHVEYLSDEDSLDKHNEYLTYEGFRVLSVKSRPATDTDLIDYRLDGNQPVVDGKPVVGEDED